MLRFEEYQAFIETHFRGLAATIDPDLPVRWPNIAFNPPNDRTFVEWRLFSEEWFRASLGSNPIYRHVGGIQIDVLSPLNVGTRRPGAIAEAFASGFRDKQFQVEHGHNVQFRRGGVQTLDDDNNRHRLMVRVAYNRDVQT